jgi:hypothetical protein
LATVTSATSGSLNDLLLNDLLQTLAWDDEQAPRDSVIRFRFRLNGAAIGPVRRVASSCSVPCNARVLPDREAE